MKKTLVSLGLLTAMLIGSQSFAACPCSSNFYSYQTSSPCACPCQKIVQPCCPAVKPCCPVVTPCCPAAKPCCPACQMPQFQTGAACPCPAKCNDCNTCNDCCD